MFRCVACKTSIFLGKHFPLCEICDQSLVTCPALCSICASPACQPGACNRFWDPISKIHSYSALYLMVGSCYRILKAWKRNRGFLFNRKILQASERHRKLWTQFQPDAIIPIPQRFFHAWKMRGSPTETLARWMSTLIDAPVVWALKYPYTTQKQSSLTITERLQSKRFCLENLTTLPKNVILVDDFRTTGQTLHEASSLLKEAGVINIHVFCLGIRGTKSNFLKK